MPFRVEDFVDLIRILDERPEWRAELRRLVLTDELLRLPEQVQALTETVERLREAQARAEERLGRLEAVVERLAEAQARTEERLGRLEAAVERLAEAQVRTEERLGRLEAAVERLAEAQVRTEERLGRLEAAVERLAEAQVRTEERVGRLEEAQARAEEQLAWLIEVVPPMMDDLGALKGDALERRYRERPFTYFGRLIRRAHTLTSDELEGLIEGAVEQGLLSQDEAAEVAEADAVIRGRWREDGAEVYLVVEISWGVGPSDVERAVRRAELLARAGVTAWPVVAGRAVTAEAAALAQERKVWQFTDGRPTPPK